MLNFHWFFDKLNLTGSNYQLYNGLLLIATFFGCRVVWGPIQSFAVFHDVYVAWQSPFSSLVSSSSSSSSEEFEPLTTTNTLPVWLGLTYLGSNTILNLLNYYWFGKMIEAVRKRFIKPSEKKTQDKDNGKKEGVRNVESTEVEVKIIDLGNVNGKESKKEL